VVLVPPPDDAIIITCSTADPGAGGWPTAAAFGLLLLLPLAARWRLKRAVRRA
jgi:hypothetical protein